MSIEVTSHKSIHKKGKVDYTGYMYSKIFDYD